MGTSKVNGGSSYPNQGDRDKSGEDSSQGQNVPGQAKSSPAKQDAKAWKSKGKNNPSVPDWLA